MTIELLEFVAMRSRLAKIGISLSFLLEKLRKIRFTWGFLLVSDSLRFHFFSVLGFGDSSVGMVTKVGRSHRDLVLLVFSFVRDFLIKDFPLIKFVIFGYFVLVTSGRSIYTQHGARGRQSALIRSQLRPDDLQITGTKYKLHFSHG